MRRILALCLMAALATTAADRYVRAAVEAGVPRDQFTNLCRAGVALQPRQLVASAAARLCDRPCDHADDVDCGPRCAPTQIGFGGARMGGKSHWMMAQIGADDCQRFAGLKGLILRKVGAAGKENFEDLIPKTLGGLKHRYIPTSNTLVFPNGSRIKLGGFKDEKDIEKYLGIEYDVIGIEEATQLSGTKYKSIRASCRTTKPGWRARLYSTTNPGGHGHAWYKARFITPNRLGAETETRFIKSTVRDNRHAGPSYRRVLSDLSGWQLRAWLDGDWDIQAGQFFESFSHDVHTVEPFEVPEDWRSWRSLDYGFVHYTASHLFVQSLDGDVFAIDEHAERKWLIESHCEGIRAMTARHGIDEHRVEATVTGSDSFAKKHDGKPIADEYARHGVPLSQAKTSRTDGAAEILRRLGDPAGGKRPTLYVSRRCTRLIEALPVMEHDPDEPEKVLKVDCDDDGIGGDDAYDSCRYGVMYVAGGPRLMVRHDDEPYRG